MASFRLNMFSSISSGLSSLQSSASSLLAGFSQSRAEFPFIMEYNPTAADVLAVKRAVYLASTSLLPLELIDTIIDYAEYWPCTSVSTTSESRVPFAVPYRPGPRSLQDKMVLRSAPIGYSPEDIDDPAYAIPLQEFCIGQGHYDQASQPHVHNCTSEVISKWKAPGLLRGNRTCRKIVFTIRSHDQGWGGDAGHKGTFTGSYTWFDVGKERLMAVQTIKSDEKSLTNGGEASRASHEQGTIQPVERNVDPKTTASDDDSLCRINNNSIRIAMQAVSPALQSPDAPSTRQISAPPLDASRLQQFRASMPATDFNAPKWKLEHPFLPTDETLQKNMTATKATQTHIITWSADDYLDPDSTEAEQLTEMGRGRATGSGEFIRNLAVGDCVTVWARARFPGWTNCVESVKMDVYWTI